MLITFHQLQGEILTFLSVFAASVFLTSENHLLFINGDDNSTSEMSIFYISQDKLIKIYASRRCLYIRNEKQKWEIPIKQKLI